MTRYVIAGNGTAAAGCIEGIRSADPDGKITVISEEEHHVYSRPLISYYLEGKTDIERMKYRPDDFYDRNGCEVLYGVKAEKLDAEKHSVTLSDGSELPYDRFCAATGSVPFVPPVEGLETVKDRTCFMKLDEALKLESMINSGSDVLIVGAGLIGLKCAEGISGRVKSITVCDLADRVLSSILDAECAGRVQEHLEKNGIRFMLSDTAVRFDGNTAYMKSGAEVGFDVLVMAVGVRACTSFFRDAGGDVGRGIRVNARMETSLPDVFAAGDCTEGEDISSGTSRVLAIMPNAYIQGHTAGANMACGDEVFDCAIPMNSIGFFGLHMMTAGSYDGEKITRDTESSVRRFFVKDGTLRGFILIGETERAGIYTYLIRERIPLDTLTDGFADVPATNAIFSSETRGKRFGGAV